MELGPRSENRPVDVNGEVYREISVQRDTQLKCDLVDLTSRDEGDVHKIAFQVNIFGTARVLM